MLNEIVTQAHILLPGVEQTFGTLTLPHALCEIVVDPNGQLQASNSDWRLYDVTPAGAALIWHGALTPPFEGPQRLTPVGGVAAGSTVELRAFSVGSTATLLPVSASLVGYDPKCCDGQVEPCCCDPLIAQVETIQTTASETFAPLLSIFFDNTAPTVKVLATTSATLTVGELGEIDRGIYRILLDGLELDGSQAGFAATLGGNAIALVLSELATGSHSVVLEWRVTDDTNTLTIDPAGVGQHATLTLEGCITPSIIT